MVNWKELPQDVLQLIARRLAIEDFIALRGVCTLWWSAALKEAYKVKSKAPWLMTYLREQTPEFFSPSRGRINRGMVPGSKGQTLSPPVWILVSNRGCKYRVSNPLSFVGIRLPALEKLSPISCLSAEHNGILVERLWRGPHAIHKIALSSSPSLSRSYTVMISYTGSRRFAFHRSGEDTRTVVSPVTQHQLWCTVLQLIYYDGLFVALDVNRQITTLNERKHCMELRLVLGLNDGKRDPYLVECSGSLLVDWMIWGKKYESVEKIRVFEVDLEKGTQEEVKSLGNTSLFLNGNSSFSVEFNAESCLPGIKPNHIYFTDCVEQKKKSCSMVNGKVGPCPDAASCHHYAAEWFQPDF